MTAYMVTYRWNGDEPSWDGAACFEGDTPEAAIELAKTILIDAGWETLESCEEHNFTAREADGDEALMALLSGSHFTAQDVGNEAIVNVPDTRPKR